MSDIKMSEVFSLPLYTEEGEVCDCDGGLMASFTTYIQDDAAVLAINTHDTLVAHNLALKAALETLIGRSQKVGGFPCGYLDDAYKALELSE